MEVVIFILIIGVIVWGIKAAPFIDGDWKTLGYIVLAIYSIIWVLQKIGLITSLSFMSIK